MLERDDFCLDRHCERSEAVHVALPWIASLRSQ